MKSFIRNVLLPLMLLSGALYGYAQGTVVYTNNPAITHGMKNQGTYSAGTTYSTNDVVIFSGAGYLSLVSSNIGHTPSSSPTQWQPLGSASGGTNPGATAAIYKWNGTAWVVTVPGTDYATPAQVTAVQTAAEVIAHKGVASGYAPLDSSSLVPLTNLPALVASGTGHKAGVAPDPGATAGTTRYLREDGTWVVPSGAGNVSTSSANTYTTGAQNMAAATGLVVPNLASIPAVNGEIVYNTTLGEYEGYAGGGWVFPRIAPGGATTGHCVTWLGPYQLGDAGSACGTSAGSNPTGGAGFYKWSGTAWTFATLNVDYYGPDATKNAQEAYQAGSGGDSTCPAAAAGQDITCYFSAANARKRSVNGSAFGYTPTVFTPGTSGHAAAYASNGIDLIDGGAFMTPATPLVAAQEPAHTGDVTNPATSLALTLAAKYKTLTCSGAGLDGMNSTTAIGAGTYTQVNCYNGTGATWTITGVKCFTDNNGTSALTLTNHAGTAILTGAVTCTNSWASGTLSVTTLAAGDELHFSFVADASTKNASFVVTGSY